MYSITETIFCFFINRQPGIFYKKYLLHNVVTGLLRSWRKAGQCLEASKNSMKELSEKSPGSYSF
jgi:hypothetical protein